MIELTNVTKKFGPVVAVDDLTLKVRPGEIFGFLGPNGAGKTTTIKMITGLYEPTSGKLTVGGYDMGERPLEAKALIGYIPDEPFIYEQLTGIEFLNFVGAIFGISESERSARIEQLLTIFPIAEVINGFFGDYSRGTKQKITILAALLHDPSVLVIDEPMVGLDPQSVRIVKNLLRDFVADGNRSVLMSTHSLNIAESICDRVAIIDRGRLQERGTIDELRRKAKMEIGSLEDLFLKVCPARPETALAG